MKIKSIIKASVVPVLVIVLMVFMSVVSFAEDSTANWTAKKSMSTARYALGTATVNGKIYAIGGFDSSNNALDLVEEYDPKTDTWATKTHMPTARGFFGIAVVNDKIYVLGGSNSSSAKPAMNIVEEYDPMNDKWTTGKSTMPIANSYMGSGSLNEKIYLACGLIESGKYSYSLQEYDTSTDTWKIKNSLWPSYYETYGSTMATLNNKLYYIGGYSRNALSAWDCFAEYDQTNDTWTAKSSMPTYRFGHGSTVHNGKIIVVGGGRNNNSDNRLDEYDLVNNKWVSKTNSGVNKTNFGLSECNGKVYSIGGIYSGQVLNTVEELVEDKPPVPTNLKAEKIESNVTLTWDKVDNAVSYNVKRSTTAGGPYTTIASNVSTNSYTDSTTESGTIYYYVVTAITPNGESEISNEISTSLTTNPALTATASADKTKIGDEFTTDIAIHNVTNICAEDIKITYDSNLFEYVGATAQTGLKIYKEDSSTPGTVRFIVACQGKDNVATGDKNLIQLKFKAKSRGVGKVDIIKGRIADNATLEMDVADENCGEATIEIGGKDVNRTDSFTLLDLGIDAYYFGFNAADTDTTKYDADLDSNGKIDDGDLTSITESILLNKDYPLN